jgi:hypothetical protein
LLQQTGDTQHNYSSRSYAGATLLCSAPSGEPAGFEGLICSMTFFESPSVLTSGFL